MEILMLIVSALACITAIANVILAFIIHQGKTNSSSSKIREKKMHWVLLPIMTLFYIAVQVDFILYGEPFTFPKLFRTAFIIGYSVWFMYKYRSIWKSKRKDRSPDLE